MNCLEEPQAAGVALSQPQRIQREQKTNGPGRRPRGLGTRPLQAGGRSPGPSCPGRCSPAPRGFVRKPRALSRGAGRDRTNSWSWIRNPTRQSPGGPVLSHHQLDAAGQTALSDSRKGRTINQRVPKGVQGGLCLPGGHLTTSKDVSDRHSRGRCYWLLVGRGQECW